MTLVDFCRKYSFFVFINSKECGELYNNVAFCYFL